MKDLEVAKKTYEEIFNCKIYKEEVVASQGVITSFLRQGPNKIELLAATNPNSPITKFLEKRGEGLHHIAFEVNDIHIEMKRLQQLGYTLLNDKPQVGADNKLICFLHPRDAHGVLIELCQDQHPTEYAK